MYKCMYVCMCACLWVCVIFTHSQHAGEIRKPSRNIISQP